MRSSSLPLVALVVVIAGCAPGAVGEEDASPGTEADLSQGELAVDPRTGTVFALHSVVGEDCFADLYVGAVRAGASASVPLATLADRWQSRLFFPEGSVALLGGYRDGEHAELAFYEPTSLQLQARYELETWPSAFALDDSRRFIAASAPVDPFAPVAPDVDDPLQDEGRVREDGAERERTVEGDGGGARVCPSLGAVPLGPQRSLFLLDTARLERVHLEVNADGLRLGWRTGHPDLVVVAEDAPTVPGQARLRVMAYAVTAGDAPPTGEPPPLALSATTLPTRVRFALVLEDLRIARSTLERRRAQLVSDPTGRFSALPVDRILSGRVKCGGAGARCTAPAVLLIDHEQRSATVLRDLGGPVGFAGTGELVAWQVRPTDDPLAKRRPAPQLVVTDLVGGKSRAVEVFMVGTPSFAFVPGSPLVLVGSSGGAAPLTLLDARAGSVTRVAGSYGHLAPFVLDPARRSVWLLGDHLLRVDLDAARASETWTPLAPTALSLIPATGELVLRRALEPAVHFLSPEDAVWGSQRGAVRMRSVHLGVD